MEYNGKQDRRQPSDYMLSVMIPIASTYARKYGKGVAAAYLQNRKIPSQRIAWILAGCEERRQSADPANLRAEEESIG
jgi:hypothetical protein